MVCATSFFFCLWCHQISLCLFVCVTSRDYHIAAICERLRWIPRISHLFHASEQNQSWTKKNERIARTTRTTNDKNEKNPWTLRIYSALKSYCLSLVIVLEFPPSPLSRRFSSKSDIGLSHRLCVCCYRMKKSSSKYFCGQWNGGNAKMKKRTHRTWEIEYSQIKSEDEKDEKFLSLFTFVIWCARFELGIVTQTGTKHQQQRLKFQLECLMLLLLYVVFWCGVGAFEHCTRCRVLFKQIEMLPHAKLFITWNRIFW